MCWVNKIRKYNKQQKSKIYIQKMQQQTNTRQLLQQAKQKFNSGDFNTAKTKMQQISEDDKSIQLNKLLIQFQLATTQNSEPILNKLLNMLTQINIDLYKKNIPNEINFISHEMLYYNIVAIAEYLGKCTLAQLVGAQALFFYKCLQTNTVLMLICQNLKKSLAQNRFSTSLQLIQKFQKVSEHAKGLSNYEQKYKIIINVLFISTLLKLHMVEQSQGLYMLKFDESEPDKFISQQRSTKTKRKSKIIYKDILNYLKAEIDFASKNYEKSIGLMMPYLTSESNKQKIYAENNIAINFCSSGKPMAAQKIFLANLQTLHKALSTNKKVGTQVPELFQKTKQNMMLAYLYQRHNLNSATHFNVEVDQKYYNVIKSAEQSFSYKQEYRRGQTCLNLYHSTLEKTSRKLPWEQIHDNYDNVYYFPNQPYFQFKGRNKNVYSANKKPVYRRYVLNQFTDDISSVQPVDKDQPQHKQKYRKQSTSKLVQMLERAEFCFKKSLILLQKQQSLVVHLEGAQAADINKTVNQKLYYQFAKFKSSILCLLTYTSLCLCKWGQAIKYGEQFTNKKCGQISPQNNYSVLTYQMEAYSQLNRMQQAYKVMTNIISTMPSKTVNVDCRDGASVSNCNMQFGISQQMNFIYNMSVLHSRDNRIPEAHQSIQKLFTQMNVLPNYPKTQPSLSILELLIHYNLRTQNFAAALQLIKRRRILAVGNGLKPILNITK